MRHNSSANAGRLQVSLHHLLLACLFVLPLTGCDPSAIEMQDLRDFVKNDASDLRGVIPPPPDIYLHPAIHFEAPSSMQQPFDPARLRVAHGR